MRISGLFVWSVSSLVAIASGFDASAVSSATAPLIQPTTDEPLCSKCNLNWRHLPTKLVTSANAACKTTFQRIPVKPLAVALTCAALAKATMAWADKALWTPSRPYEYDRSANTVGHEYDAWTSEGILEHYWGEHIHLGFYKDNEQPKLDLFPPKKNFIEAKQDFVDEMLKFSTFEKPVHPFRVLDVGCGIGGTSRYLAKKFGELATVTGVTISPMQAKRATDLALQQNVNNARFEVMDALNMRFPDNSFDLVWACESAEHMPDKKKFLEEISRVLKPGGKVVIATWCQRNDKLKPFSKEERRMLDFLYSEWTHPFFLSIDEYKQMIMDNESLGDVHTENWTKQTISSWLHSLWVGAFDPLPVLCKPKLWGKCFRDGLTLTRMHKSFKSGLMEYGMMRATKKISPPSDE